MIATAATKKLTSRQILPRYVLTTPSGKRIELSVTNGDHRLNPVVLGTGIMSTYGIFELLLNRTQSWREAISDFGFPIVAFNWPGHESAPSKLDRDYHFDHLVDDVFPTVIEFVSNLFGRKVNYLGHSMGGLVVEAALALYPELQQYINTITALGSPTRLLPQSWLTDKTLTFGSQFQGKMNKWGLDKHNPVDSIRILLNNAGCLPGSIVYSIVMLKALGGDEIDPSINRKELAKVIRSLTPGERLSFLTFRACNGLHRLDRSFDYRKNFENIKLPIRLVAAENDIFISPADMAEDIALYGTPEEQKQFVVMKKYGHVQLILGSNSIEEVLEPTVRELWLPYAKAA